MISINRIKSIRAREASFYLKMNREDLLNSSMFYQLWNELKNENIEKLRMSYVHPMDDGQARIFKVKFEGEVIIYIF